MKIVDLEGNRSELTEAKPEKARKEPDAEMNDYDDEEESEDESFNDQGAASESSDADEEDDSQMIDSELD
jgi:hypothetical protein